MSARTQSFDTDALGAGVSHISHKTKQTDPIQTSRPGNVRTVSDLGGAHCAPVHTMGSGRDKRKKAKPRAPGAGADKTTRKTVKNADKAVKRATKAAQVASIPIELPYVVDRSLTLSFGQSKPIAKASPHNVRLDYSTKPRHSAQYCFNPPNVVWLNFRTKMQGGDDDVDALLSQFNLEEKAKSAAQIRENADPPSARTYASFTPHPTTVSL